MMIKKWFALALVMAVAVPGLARAEGPFITVASTTSTQNSGLFKDILPKFTAESGIEVRVVAVGTGQAIRLAAKGDADVLFVHHRPSEEKFVADGLGVARLDVMYNDFVVIGPDADPAGIKGLTDAVQAFTKIAEKKAIFASRGDDSGTNKKELGLWKLAGVDVKTVSGSWYRETGSGMGATLNAASGMSAYTLSDRGTWLSFKNRKGIRLLAEGDARLFNPYGVILVNAAKHPHIKTAEGQAFIDWLVSEAGQQAISDYQVGGKQLFFANAKAPGSS
ncbi:MAG: extracellular solute-binding protein [Rhodospirillales bacterium]|nr:extracellular solute-binding protein [Rhodospirillales bacterium]